ncbi:hypothetical protein FOZ60_007118 [Perkinsus olseni]|uniref:Integrase catalytic domain-containing protein n=1 Tax=Perkinsus olseni TaxID=32597 RepID=A0A7J6NML6_PEROL|nr:hypothetical protein FOZ60_007118 [Perkinsus olseni]
MRGLTPLYLGRCIATLVVTDSNVQSWYGAILGVVVLNADSACPALFPELEERLYNVSPCDDIFPMPPSGMTYRVLPVRLCGGVWKKREQLRSSTWRERGAQLQCVSENLDALRGDRVISLNDNANLYMSARRLADDDLGGDVAGEVKVLPVRADDSSNELNVDDRTKREGRIVTRRLCCGCLLSRRKMSSWLRSANPVDGELMSRSLSRLLCLIVMAFALLYWASFMSMGFMDLLKCYPAWYSWLIGGLPYAETISACRDLDSVFKFRCHGIRLDRIYLCSPVDSACVVNAYLYAFSLYGYPRHLRCDGGGNLVSQEVASWLLAHGVQNTVAVGYSPWTGGYYERRHKDLASSLRKFLLDLKYGTGAMYVNSPFALAAMLQNQLNSYGMDWRGARDTTPQMLMTGTIPKPPASLDDIAPRDRWSSQGVFGGINLEEASGEDVAAEEAKLVEVLRKRASDIRRRRDDCLRDFNMIWLERREEARNSFDQTLARKQTKESLKVGDRVLLAERSPSKLAPRWSKPQEVVALRGLRCIIKDDNGTLREVHLRYVKKFCDDDGEIPQAASSKRDRCEETDDEDADSGHGNGHHDAAASSAIRTRPVRKCSRMVSYAHQL